MYSKSQFVSGVFFTALARYTNLAVNLIVMAVLSRLLLPEQFGVVAIATAIISFASLFTDIGLTSTIIQFKGLDKSDFNKLFSISFFLGVILSLFIFLIAFVFAEYYDDDLLKPICQLLSISLFFNTLSVVPNAIFYREKLFKEIAVRSTLAQVLGGFLAVGWALKYQSLYALVINPILSSIVIFIISYKRFPLRILFSFSLKSISHTFSYSFYQFLFNIVNFFSKNLDTFIVGKHLGPISLGYYDKAYRLMSMPLQNIVLVVTPVLHPLLSVKSDEKGYLMRVNELLTKIFSIIGFPMSVWLYFVSEELMILFFGPQWTPAVVPFQYFSLSLGVQLLSSSTGSFFQAGGETKGLFKRGVFSAILNVSAIILGTLYFQNIDIVALGLFIASVISFIQAYWLLYYRVFETKSSRFLLLLIRPLVYSLILAGVFIGLLNYINIDSIIVSFVLKTLLYLIAMLIIVFFGGYKSIVLSLVKNKKISID